MAAVAHPDGTGGDVTVVIPQWGLEQHLHADSSTGGVGQMLTTLLKELDLTNESLTIDVEPRVPRAMGLGGSAALAVAIIRALDQAYTLKLSDERVNELAFECEKSAHGTPSGIDNTVATFGQPLWYQRGPEAREAPGTGWLVVVWNHRRNDGPRGTGHRRCQLGAVHAGERSRAGHWYHRPGKPDGCHGRSGAEELGSPTGGAQCDLRSDQ